METTNKPILQEFQLEGVMHISPKKAFEAVCNGDAVIIDVREEDELRRESLDLAYVLNHPMSVILDRLSYISKDQNIIVMCAVGIRSTKVANLLNINDYPHVANLDGGLMHWKLQGLPYESKETSGCGCGCSCSAPAKSESSCCDNENEGCCS